MRFFSRIAFGLSIIYLVYLGVYYIDRLWTPLSWPHFSHVGRPRPLTVQPEVSSSYTSPPFSSYSSDEAPTIATTANAPGSPNEVSTLITAVSTSLPQTMDATVMETLSSQPSPTTLSKIIVMARLERENTSWVKDNLPEWQRAIYTVDNTSATHHTPRNKGREANVYLTYVVENYDHLPDIIVFLHSHRDGYPQAWHTDAANYDNVASINSLRLDTVQKHGYVNLRCNPAIGCPDEMQPFRDPPKPDGGPEQLYREAWHVMMGPDLPVPRVVGVACCSQFAVSRKQVLARPRADYQRYLDWLMQTNATDDVSGRILEYMWHIIYGQSAVYCPPMHQCYCDVYGRC